MIQKIHAFIPTIKNTKQEALKGTPAKRRTNEKRRDESESTAYL